ncbi:MAG: alpha/beta hydrolase [Anaerolineaceae bacterium]|nr:alpha/beta hydrolase [Anaerolineaceae bacterium]
MTKHPVIRQRRRLLPRIAAATLLLALAGLAYFLLSGPRAEPAALAALVPDETLVLRDEGWLTLAPRGAAPAAGLVFYPGGLVPTEAYAPLARAVAAEGYLVALLRMPLNLAVLDSGRALAVLESYPEIGRWVVAGHSLGGSMAARFAADYSQGIDGLLLLAAWPEDSVDLSSSPLAVTSVYGSEDGLATPGEVLAAAPRLPADTAFIRIEGGNHAQFGRYGRQNGDNEALISPDEQLAQTVEVALALLRRVVAAG